MKSPEERMTNLPLPLASPRRNLNLCFTKLRFPLRSHSRLPPPPPLPAATTLIKTYNFLYDASASPSLSSSTLSSSSDDDSAAASEPNLSAIYASRRFFFSSPGESNSIVESSARRPDTDPVVGGGVAVPTISPDPYGDFRRSMQEMVDARQLFDVKSNWECLHELLLCYLSLNPKSTHKFIVGAFSDLLVTLMCEGGGDLQPPRLTA